MTMPTTASTTASNTARTAATIDVQASAKRDILIRPRSDADDVYPSIDDMAGLRAYFEREGFVVLRRALPPLACETARQAFLREALPARRAYFKRHASGRYERNVYTEHGHMKFPIMNLQDIGGRRFRQFRQRGLELLTHDHVQHIMRGMFGEPGRLVHTMYFDGNQATWAHRDGDYFDSAASGRMIGVWIAAEDIHPDAGRFYVVPRSHCSAIPGIDNPNGDGYKDRIAEFVRSGPLDCVAPLMQQGDVILWSAMTVHGSLPTVDPRQTRRSFTGHYVPDSQPCKRHLTSAPTDRYVTVNNVPILLHQDSHTLSGLLREMLRSEYPALYRAVQGMNSLMRPLNLR
jgi:phytanoyl-CoA hydroxylase